MGIQLNLVDRDGITHVLHVAPAGSLMEVLRELEYGVTALCGGMCSCATCHVYVSPRWLEKLPASQNDERDMVGELQFSCDSSRLSCRIELSEALDGLTVTLAPEE
jgi:2Fe-2S ferredoxin